VNLPPAVLGSRHSADSSNLIVFVVKNERIYPQWSRLMSKAQTLGKRYRLELPWGINNMLLREDPDD